MKYRDPDTGELKDIYVKASDTLPIGTVVEYDGTEIPDNWEKIDDVSQSKVSECLFIKKDNIVFAHGWFIINGTSATFTAPFKPASKNVWFPVVGLNTEQTPMSYGRALFNTNGTITITMTSASTYATAGFTYLTNE